MVTIPYIPDFGWEFIQVFRRRVLIECINPTMLYFLQGDEISPMSCAVTYLKLYYYDERNTSTYDTNIASVKSNDDKIIVGLYDISKPGKYPLTIDGFVIEYEKKERV